MGHARGVLCLASAQAGVAVHTLGHARVKRALVGSGSARKEQVNAMVTQLLGLAPAPKPNDVSDALALALAFLNVLASRPHAPCSLGSRARSSSASARRAVVEAGGLGYEIVLAAVHRREDSRRRRASASTLEIYAVVNIDGNSGRFTYYGFTNAIEREFFEALITVASIGPRSAARAFCAPMSAIAGAIDRGDYAFLKTLPGIGQQKARDIVAKLQGKVAKFLLIRDAPPAAPRADSRLRGRSARRAAAARVQTHAKARR